MILYENTNINYSWLPILTLLPETFNYSKNLNTFEPYKSPDMIHETFFETDKKQRRVFYQKWAPGQKPKGVIALVHGLGEHSGRYAHVADFFTSHGWAMYAVDVYGHGNTTGKRGHADSMEAYMQQISRLLELAKQSAPDKPVFLYGHSMGGGLVLNYLFRNKPSVAGVIATSPAIRPGFKPSGLMLTIGRIARIIAPSFTQANSLDLDNLSHDPQVIAAYKADPLVHSQVSGTVGLGVIEWGEWLLENAKQAPIPLLIMHGARDKLTSYEASKLFASQLTGDVNFKSYKDLYHELHNEYEKQEVMNDILNWMNKHI